MQLVSPHVSAAQLEDAFSENNMRRKSTPKLRKTPASSRRASRASSGQASATAPAADAYADEGFEDYDFEGFEPLEATTSPGSFKEEPVQEESEEQTTDWGGALPAVVAAAQRGTIKGPVFQQGVNDSDEEIERAPQDSSAWGMTALAADPAPQLVDSWSRCRG
jgi:hypothetical protein